VGDDEIRDLQRRVTELERQNRQLLLALARDDGYRARGPLAGLVCWNTACLNSTLKPHMAEQPYGCPRLASGG